MKKVLLPVLLFLLNFLNGSSLFSATVHTAQSGDFSISSTWAGGIIPTINDIVVISPGDTVSFTADVTLRYIIINTGGVLDNMGFVLNISEAGSGTLFTIDGLYTGFGPTYFNLSSSTSSNNRMNGSGTISASGGIYYFGTNTAAQIDSTANLTFNMGEGIVLNTGGMPGMNNMYCYGTINFITGELQVGKLWVSASRLIIGSTGQIIIASGNINMASNSSVLNYGVVTISGDVETGSTISSWYNYSGSTINIAGNFLQLSANPNANAKLYANYSGNTVNYNGTGSQRIIKPNLTASTYWHLKCSNSGTKTLAANTLINGDLTIQDNAQLDVSKDWGTTNYNINIKGNWVNTSTNADPFVEHNDTVTFSGTDPQTITGTVAGGETFYDLVINNSNTGVVLKGSNINVSDTLTLNDGLIHTGLDTVWVRNADTAAIKGYSDSSYVNGHLQRSISPTGGSYDFPVGNADALELARLDFIGSNTIGSLTADFSNPTGGTTLSSLTDANDAVYDKLLNCGGAATATGNANSGVWNIRPGKGSAIYDLSLYGRHFDNPGTMYHSIVRRYSSLIPWEFAGTYKSASGTEPLIANRTCLTDFYQFAIAGSNTIYPLSTTPLSFNSMDTLICGSKCISFSSRNNFTATRWKWKISGGTFANFIDSLSQNPSNICFNTEGKYDVRLITSNACTADTLEKMQYIHVNAIPTVIIKASYNKTSICRGDSVQLRASYGNYLWSTGATTGVISVSPLSSTIYSLVLSNGICSDTGTVGITVYPKPSAAISANTTAICSESSAVLTASAIEGGSGNYLWSTGATTNAIVVSPTSTQSYTVTLSNGNCVDMDEITINVNTTPSAFITGETSICSGKRIVLLGTSLIPGLTYLWSTGNTSQGINATPLTNTTYSLLVSNGICRDTASINITVTATPTVVLASNKSTICNGDTVQLSATGAGNFIWSNGSQNNTVFVNPASSQTYTVTLNNGNCSDMDTISIKVTNTSIIASKTSICSGESVILASSGPGNFIWNTGQTAASISVSPIVNTTYSLIAYNGNCFNTASVDISVNSSPVINLSVDKNNICTGESALLTASSTGGGKEYYLWSTGASTSAMNVSPLTSTTYSLVVFNGICKDSASVNIKVNASPSISISPNKDLCSGDQTLITASGGSDYTWSFNSLRGNSILVNPAITTSYTVTAFGNNGCQGSATSTVTILSKPILTITKTDAACGQSNGTALVTVYGKSPYTYLWTSGTSTIGATPNVSNLVAKGYEIKVTDGNGCIATDNANIGNTGGGPSVSNFNSTNASCSSICDGIATVSVIDGVLPYSYLWNSPSAETTQTAFNLCQNTYEVKITDGAGCKVSAIIKVGTDGADPTISGLIKIKIDGVPEVVKKGYVALYRFRAEKALELIVSAPISAIGTYSLPYFKEGDYLIAAEADTSMYPNSAKTYYGEKIKWTEADTVQAPCNSSNLISIDIINLIPKTGKGKIKGQIKDVSHGKTFAAGDPIPGVDISLEQIPGGIVATGKTSSNGEYNFDNITEGIFRVFVDMPGLDMNHTHQIAVTPTDTMFKDANFWVDSTGTIDTVIQKTITNIGVQVKNENFTYSVFPNPYTGVTNIAYTLEEKSTVNIEVYNVLGELIKIIENKKDQLAGNYQLKFNAEENGCGAGIYILRLTINGRSFTQGMSQMK